MVFLWLLVMSVLVLAGASVSALNLSLGIHLKRKHLPQTMMKTTNMSASANDVSLPSNPLCLITFVIKSQCVSDLFAFFAVLQALSGKSA